MRVRNKATVENRIQRTILSKSNCEQYTILECYCHESKNLYNYANYLLRQAYKEKDFTLFNFYKLREHLRNLKDEFNPWSRQATSHIAAETIQVLVNSWSSYFASVKSYSEHPKKFKAPPKPPNYLPKNGKFLMVLDTTAFKLKDGVVSFPKTFEGLNVLFDQTNKIYQVRLVPQHNHIAVDVVYRIDQVAKQADNNRYLSIDLGVSNFATITSNIPNFRSVVVNGKGLKSINQYYNKQIAHYSAVADSLVQSKVTKRKQAITWKRNQRIHDFMHKATKYIVDLAITTNVSTVVCGYNAGWKGKLKFSKEDKQNFIGLPYLKFVSMLRYKLADKGITLVLTEESYTSKTSFLDEEYPEHKQFYQGNRKYRGLFISSSKQTINADCNGSYQILKKVFPKAYADGIEGVSLHPVRVNVSDLCKRQNCA